MKLITRDTDYALRALCFISRSSAGKFSVTKLSKELGVPRPFLRKILQTLNKQKILESTRGKAGGFILAKDPKKIFLTDIIGIFQGRLKLNECFLNRLICPDQRTCLLRKMLVKIERYVLKELGSITIASLLK
ncbi:MAG: Rrf2 family transcriptional regulator [Candidatus Omnitrophica bacterium]|jgi:Rrf2 family protein|nr:Rrf2 family transcriptional regulator [Candidatus Omnitrophota bacterium]